MTPVAKGERRLRSRADYLESVSNGAAKGRPNNEPGCEALCRKHGTTTEGAFRNVVTYLDPSAVMTLLNGEVRESLATWRGPLR